MTKYDFLLGESCVFPEILMMFSGSLLSPSFCKPHLTLSSLYPSEFLVQKITEDNQVPVHLRVSASLQYVAGLKGNALVEFFHGNIAEVLHLAWVYKSMT